MKSLHARAEGDGVQLEEIVVVHTGAEQLPIDHADNPVVDVNRRITRLVEAFWGPR